MENGMVSFALGFVAAAGCQGFKELFKGIDEIRQYVSRLGREFQFNFGSRTHVLGNFVSLNTYSTD